MRHKSSRLFLRRYTDLAPLLYLLEKRVITLLNPRLWDDRNDAYFLELHRQKKCLECVLALCFTEASETYHHWRVFAGGSSGVCLEFDKTLLLTSLGGVPGLRTGSVQYLTINALEKAAAKSTDLPFVKRYPYRDEREFRLIYEDSKGATAPKDVPFDPTALRKVVINPWMANSVYESVKVVIRGIEGWDHLRVQRTTLVDNERWRQLGKRGEPSNQTLPRTTGRTSKNVTSKRRSKALRG